MKKNYKVRIIVPANTTAFNERMEQVVKPVVPPDVDYDIKNITRGHDCIENRCNLAENVMGVVELAKQTEKEGYHGIFVTDFDMCGVAPAREVVNIPVIGGFRASAFTAMMLSERFSIITILDSTVGMQWEHIKSFGLAANFASIRSINCPVKDLENTEEVIAMVYQACCLAIEYDGAQSFILGCTGFIGIAENVSKMLTIKYGGYVPVMDPNMTAFSYLILLVRNQYMQSRLCYAKATGY
jgi:allantoin racemase